MATRPLHEGVGAMLGLHMATTVKPELLPILSMQRTSCSAGERFLGATSNVSRALGSR